MTRSNFWLWLCRAAYRRLRQVEITPPDGIPSVRSYESRCASYAPRKPVLGDWTNCLTDGHYLCQECAHREQRTRVLANHGMAPDMEALLGE